MLTRVKFRKNTITNKERYTAATLLVEGDLESLCNKIFARVMENRKEKHKALLGAGRIAFTQSLDNSATGQCQTLI